MAKLIDCEVTITGKYCDVTHPDRKLLIEVSGLTDEQLLVVLYESCIRMREKLKKTKTKKEMLELEEKFKLFNIGIIDE